MNAFRCDFCRKNAEKIATNYQASASVCADCLKIINAAMARKQPLEHIKFLKAPGAA